MKNIRKLVIYGAGKIGKAYIDKCISFGLNQIQLCVIDSDSCLWGESYRGVEIQNPDAALTDNVDMVVIAVGSKYRTEIRQQLKERYHIADGRITYCTETLVLPKCEIYDVRNALSLHIDENMFGVLQYYDMWYEVYKTALKGMNIGTGGYGSSGELNILRQLKKSGKKIEVIFDVGANIGGYTNVLLSIFPKAQIHCFEPAKETFRTLSKNIVEPNVTLNNIGISDENANRTLYFDKENSGLASLYNRQLDYLGLEFSKREQIELMTLDKYCQNHGIDRIDFLKMDIEGNEHKALLGASGLLKRKKIGVIQIETGGTNMDSRTYFRDYWNLLHADFDVFRVLQDGVKKIEKYEEELECFITTNWLFIKNSVEKDNR